MHLTESWATVDLHAEQTIMSTDHLPRLPIELRGKILDISYKLQMQDCISELEHCISKARCSALAAYEYEDNKVPPRISWRRFWNIPPPLWFIGCRCSIEKRVRLICGSKITAKLVRDVDHRTDARDVDHHSLAVLQMLFRTAATDLFPNDIEFHRYVYSLDQSEHSTINAFFERFNDISHMSFPQVWILGERVVSYDSI
jgi:hypothetical protein